MVLSYLGVGVLGCGVLGLRSSGRVRAGRHNPQRSRAGIHWRSICFQTTGSGLTLLETVGQEMIKMHAETAKQLMICRLSGGEDARKCQDAAF